ncbi:MAG: hypothetical protein GWP62_06425 [Gammaproteobacteria bacterium]|jgi:hypothetical protein|nr:hypothetical protein [Gammaproteobacteria bacterium]
MLRLIGILTGSAIAVAFLIVALGVPDFSAPEPEQQAVADMSREPVVAAVPEPAPDLLPVPVPEPEPEPAPVEEPEPQADLEQAPDPETEALIEQIFNPGPEDLIEENWYAFWSPFRSEIAARGFVAKLQETTGIDYRVVKVKTGVYEVAFAYDDDADIQEKLARISSATGLNMTDS